MTRPSERPDEDPATAPEAESVLGMVQEVVSPTAAGHTDTSAVVVDLDQVAPPPSGASPIRYTIACVTGSLAFALLTIWVTRQGTVIPGLDERVHAWVISHRTSADTTFARAVTWGGVTTVTLPALIAVGALAGGNGADLRRRLGAGLLLSGIASGGVYLGLRINASVGRARPSPLDWAGTAGGPAFPSGHTTAATLFAASCAWALTARVRAGWPRRAVWAGAAAYAALVGWSRIWLGVHWPTDVAAGWLYGLAWFTGTSAVILALRHRTTRPRPRPEPGPGHRSRSTTDEP